MADRASSDQAGCGCLVLLGVMLGVIGYAVGVFYSPHKDPDPSDMTAASQASSTVATQLALGLPPSAETRIQQRGGFNLDVFVAQHDFESVPYPDRKDFVKAVATGWCDHVEKTWIPSVAIRDIRSGKELATYSCVLAYASLN
jgi:hypothetical protein